MLGEVARAIHATAYRKGWWPGRASSRPFPEVLMLIVSEVSEVLEEYRNHRDYNEIYAWQEAGISMPYIAEDNKKSELPVLLMYNEEGNPCKPEGIPIEMADIIIRVLDACEAYGINIERAMAIKMAYNETRPSRHGGKRA